MFQKDLSSIRKPKIRLMTPLCYVENRKKLWIFSNTSFTKKNPHFLSQEAHKMVLPLKKMVWQNFSSRKNEKKSGGLNLSYLWDYQSKRKEDRGGRK